MKNQIKNLRSKKLKIYFIFSLFTYFKFSKCLDDDEFGNNLKKVDANVKSVGVPLKHQQLDFLSREASNKLEIDLTRSELSKKFEKVQNLSEVSNKFVKNINASDASKKKKSNKLVTSKDDKSLKYFDNLAETFKFNKQPKPIESKLANTPSESKSEIEEVTFSMGIDYMNKIGSIANKKNKSKQVKQKTVNYVQNTENKGKILRNFKILNNIKKMVQKPKDFQEEKGTNFKKKPNLSENPRKNVAVNKNCSVEISNDSQLWRSQKEVETAFLPLLSAVTCYASDEKSKPCSVSTVSREIFIQSDDSLKLIVQTIELPKTGNFVNTSKTSRNNANDDDWSIKSGNEAITNDSTKNFANVLQSYTLWKVSELEWLSCSTREGGQISTNEDNGVIIIEASILPVGIHFFIGRSSWSSSECLQLKINVRTNDCVTDNSVVSPPCSNAGICFANTSMNSFACSCCNGYMGRFCEEKNGCENLVCLNGGACFDIDEGADGSNFQCLCRHGFTGKYCENTSAGSSCDSNPCLNGGKCRKNKNSFVCDCPKEFGGLDCSSKTSENEESLKFKDYPNAEAKYLNNFKKFSSANDDIKKNEHDLNFTSKFSKNLENNSYPKKFFQKYDQVDEEYFWKETRMQKLNKSNNGNSKENTNNDQNDFKTFYSTSEVNPSKNVCSNSPCVYGVCVESQEIGYKCFCQPGFGGEHCDLDYNECYSAPCLNGAECIDQIGTYKCICTEGYTGLNCNVKINLCSPDPCPPDRVCVDEGDDFSCECIRELTEEKCANEDEVCEPSPCLHGGSCYKTYDHLNFYCACRPGFAGQVCQDSTILESVSAYDDGMKSYDDENLRKNDELKRVKNFYTGAITLGCAGLIFLIVLSICHCKVDRPRCKCLLPFSTPSFRCITFSFLQKSHFRRLRKKREASALLKLDSDPEVNACISSFSNHDSCVIETCENNLESPLI